MSNILDSEFKGTPFNLKDVGGVSFADDEFDFLKKKEKPAPAQPVSTEAQVVEKTENIESLPEEEKPAVLDEKPEIPQEISSPQESAPTPETIEAEPAAGPEAKTEEEKIPAEQPVKVEPAVEEKPELDFIKKIEDFQTGQIVKGKIIKIEKNGLLVDFGHKSEGLVDLSQVNLKPNQSLETLFKLDDEIEVLILNLATRDGYVQLSQKLAEVEKAWNNAYEAFKKAKVLEVNVISAVKGGLVVDYEGLRGFLPASQILKEAEGNLEKMVDQKIPIKVIEINRSQKKIVFSHRLAAEEIKTFDSDRLWSELEVGQVRKGKVTGIKNFGAFVNLGGVEGLIHISELSWGRVRHPSEIVKVGDEVEVFIVSVDHKKKKIGLGLKQLQPDPWVKAKESYRAGQIVKVKVVRLVSFGAFVELEKGLEGLIHLSELANPAPAKPEDILKAGDEIEVKILRIIPEEQKIGLSLKAIEEQKNKEKIKETFNSKENRVTIGDIMKEKNMQIEPAKVEAPQSEPAPAPPENPASES